MYRLLHSQWYYLDHYTLVIVIIEIIKLKGKMGCVCEQIITYRHFGEEDSVVSKALGAGSDIGVRHFGLQFPCS